MGTNDTRRHFLLGGVEFLDCLTYLGTRRCCNLFVSFLALSHGVETVCVCLCVCDPRMKEGGGRKESDGARMVGNLTFS